MTVKFPRLALLPAAAFGPLVGVALLGGCGDDGSSKPMALSEENKANVAAERAGDEQARNTRTAKGQP